MWVMSENWWTRNFWNTYKCRKCYKLIQDCKCELIPCPWCDYETMWTQDWNAHMINEHPDRLKESEDYLMK